MRVTKHMVETALIATLYIVLTYPNLQLANQKSCLLSLYPAMSSHWPDMATISCSLGRICIR